MANTVIGKVGDWVKLIGTLPAAAQAVLWATPFVSAAAAWLMSAPIAYLGGIFLFVAVVAFLSGRWLAMRASVRPQPSPPTPPPLPARVPRTAVRARGNAKVDLPDAYIIDHEIGIDAADDASVKAPRSIIK